ncbi:MAG TPA: class I SAM-dependent RNA methyltransferase [Gemmatimonadaceae bacterium]|jgi:putative N6-adenine-specific DNA methylase|nr:class I SAM-dependent RNA methyltransferase [Gemmatimonadaceae bacterium]
MPESAFSALDIFASTAPGLESIAAGELKSLGVRGKQEVGGVAFGGDLRRLYEANLWLRTASRITVRLGRFHASTFFELERRAKKLPWTRFLPATGSVRLRVTCRKSKLYHSDAVAERVLAAIEGSAARGVGVEASDSDDDASDGDLRQNQAQLFIVRIVHDECEISADASGELLHRRGYRREIAKAPVRETIAAAMVLASGWKGQTPLLDPMCGSGTIPIEAALIARRIAPGLQRRFQFMDWPGFDALMWQELVGNAQRAAIDTNAEILGADRDEGAIGAAGRNAERAGVASDVNFVTQSLSSSLAMLAEDDDGSSRGPDSPNGDQSSDSGWILTNPPYGIRVAGQGDLRNLYATLGTALDANPRWRLGVLTSDAGLVRQARLSLTSRFSTSNGGIPVSFYVSARTEKRTEKGIAGVRSGVRSE